MTTEVNAVPAVIQQTKVSPRVLAEEWGVGVDRILRLIHAGELRAVNVSLGRKPRYLIDRDDVTDFENRRAVGRGDCV
jgi:excisionase family DNA binding protein